MTSSKRLFVGSLPFRYSEGELLDLFVPYGRVIFIRIVKDRFHKSRGMAFVEFDSLDSAVAAQKALHGSYVIDRSIIVDFAKPDPKAQAGDGDDLSPPRAPARPKPAIYRPAPRSPNLPSTSAPPAKKKFTSRPPHARPSSSSRPDSEGHLRQSVFNSRFHGSRSGRKFASRTRKDKRP